jgi:biopolymer transport protein ExbB/TolQ
MTHDLYHAIYRVASVLEVPVILLALAALALIVVESGRFLVELMTRRRRPSDPVQNAGLTEAALAARRALFDDRSESGAARALQRVAWSAAMEATYAAMVAHAGKPGAENRIAKDLADFDFGRQRRLERTRLLVRAGPALGLMGTLIPLAPALDGLAKGDVNALTENLRVAFSITVLGLLVGALAYGLSLARDRIYGQDYSDLEYVAAVLTDPAFESGNADSVPAEIT